MSHYTDQNPISEQAWMESVMRQLGVGKISESNPTGEKNQSLSSGGLSDKHRADYKAALDAQDQADSWKGKIAAGKEVEKVVRRIADDMGVDFFDAYDMLEKENDEAGLTPGYAPPTDY